MICDATIEEMKAQRDNRWNDWPCAFGYADGFDMDDVAEVLASYCQPGRDGYANTDVHGLFRLKDGRYATLSAWCDTTGWDCQAAGHGEVYATLEEAKRLGLTLEERERLEVTL